MDALPKPSCGEIVRKLLDQLLKMNASVGEQISTEHIGISLDNFNLTESKKTRILKSIHYNGYEFSGDGFRKIEDTSDITMYFFDIYRYGKTDKDYPPERVDTRAMPENHRIGRWNDLAWKIKQAERTVLTKKLSRCFYKFKEN